MLIHFGQGETAKRAQIALRWFLCEASRNGEQTAHNRTWIIHDLIIAKKQKIPKRSVRLADVNTDWKSSNTSLMNATLPYPFSSLIGWHINHEREAVLSCPYPPEWFGCRCVAQKWLLIKLEWKMKRWQAKKVEWLVGDDGCLIKLQGF